MQPASMLTGSADYKASGLAIYQALSASGLRLDGWCPNF